MLEELRKYRNATPFVPFTIHLSDGRHFPVNDQFHTAIGGQHRVVVYEEDKDAFMPLDDREISQVTPGVAVTR